LRLLLSTPSCAHGYLVPLAHREQTSNDFPCAVTG